MKVLKGAVVMTFRINCITGRTLCWIIFFLLNFPGNCVLHAGTFFDRPPATAVAGRWEAVDISYQKDFSYVSTYNKQHLPECTEAFVFSGKKKSHVLRCLERIELLRPASLVEQWEYIQKENGYFLLTIKALGIVDIHAHMQKIAGDTVHADLTPIAAGTVTGLSLRHVLNISEYTFENRQTGIRSTLIATPEHPFFEVNSREFIPVGMLSSHHRLLNDTNQKIKILCPGYHIDHCGKRINPIEPVRVYNMELHQKHSYFVSAAHIMVHNVCKLTYQEVYQYFNKEKLIFEQSIDMDDLPQSDSQGGVYAAVELNTFHIQYWDGDLDVLEAMNEDRLDEERLDEGMDDTFEIEKVLEHMGFIPCNAVMRNNRCYRIWTMKYPVSKDIYEENILLHITSGVSFDDFVKRYAGRYGLCYADLRNFISRVAANSIEEYPPVTPFHPLADRSMLLNSSLKNLGGRIFTYVKFY